MWHLDDQLEGWFEEVNRNRKAKYGGSSVDDSNMVDNELAKEYRRR